MCYSLILGEKYEGFGGNKRDPEVNFGTQQDPEPRFHKLQLIKDAGLARSHWKCTVGARFGNWYRELLHIHMRLLTVPLPSFFHV
jgi:hypothetical protein